MTYSQFFEEQMKMPRLSRRFTTDVVKEERDPSEFLRELFPWQLRKEKMVSYAKWSLINLIMLGYLLFFLVIFWNKWSFKKREKSCIAQLSIWTEVYLGITLAHIVRKIIIICIWKKANDPTIAVTKVDLVCLALIHLPELVWYIIGNIIIYSGGMNDC